MSDLKEIWSEQYQLPCIVVENPNDIEADSVIGMCESIGAVRNVDGKEYVVELRDVGPELWTEDALRRSLTQKGTP